MKSFACLRVSVIAVLVISLNFVVLREVPRALYLIRDSPATELHLQPLKDAFAHVFGHMLGFPEQGMNYVVVASGNSVAGRSF